MRGVETRIQEIRHAVFTEVARMAYEEGPVDKKIEALPYKIIPGETGSKKTVYITNRRMWKFLLPIHLQKYGNRTNNQNPLK